MDTEHLIASRMCKCLSKAGLDAHGDIHVYRRYNSNANAVYFVAALGVVHNPVENKQEIYGG